MRKSVVIMVVTVLLSGIKAGAQYFVEAGSALNLLHSFNPGEYGGGVSFADYDKDGWDDITFCQNGAAIKVFRNTGTGFELMSDPFQNNAEVKMVTWVDYDDDGDRDLFATCNGSSMRLFRRDGPYVFTDVTVAAGLPAQTNMDYGHSWADYDRDGDLDVYICNYDGPFMGNPGVVNQLFRNNGDGTFSEAAAQAGVQNGHFYTFMGLWFDYNQDLWPDLFIINDRTGTTNALYHNNGDGTFTDVSAASDLDFDIFSMSATGDDYDNDGDIDLYVTNNPVGNLLHRNNNDGTFTEVAEEAGVFAGDFCWSANFLDADNDGWLDLHVCSAPFWLDNGENIFYRNNGDGTFEDFTAEAGLTGDMGTTHSAAIGDFNHDGFADFVENKDNPSFSRLFAAVPTENHFLAVDLEGTVSNRDGISSWIHCYAGGNTYTRYTYCGEGYLAQHSYEEIFGLGADTLVDSLSVSWLSGITDTWYSLPAGQRLHLVEGTGFMPAISGAGEICPGDSLQLDAGEYGDYLWTTGETTRLIWVTEPGEYRVLVTTTGGIQSWSAPVYISETEFTVEVIGVSDVPCAGGSDGAVILSVWPENSTVLWEDDAEGAIRENLVAGEYAYTVSGPNECSVSGVVTIVQPDSLELSLEVTQPECFGETGFAVAAAGGGTPPYTMDFGGLDPLSLPEGLVTATVTDAHGCARSVEFMIHVPEELVVSVTTTPEFEGGEEGSATAGISGGTAPYLILWSTGEQNTTAVNGLEAGSYTVVVMDSAGCTVAQEFTIDWISGIHEISGEQLSVSPNPASRQVRILFPGGTWKWELLAPDGISVRTGEKTERDTIIDLEGLPNGSYLLRATSGERVLSGRLLVTR